MIDPRMAVSISSFMSEINNKSGSKSVEIPHATTDYNKVSYGEAEWEFWVSKLHWNYLRATEADLEIIKAIVQRVSA